jgi:short subunit dehydrogenase-like uncharacterized protein
MVTNNNSVVAVIGATGRTGRDFVGMAVDKGFQLRLIGRDDRALAALAADKPATWMHVDSLSDSAMRSAVAGTALVVNLAGPFSGTAAMVARCALDASASYLDISNEYEAVQSVLDLDAEARVRGVTLMPASGFGTLVTEGLAATLGADGEAYRVDVAMFPDNRGRSKGALQSVLAVLAHGGARIEDGVLRRIVLGSDARRLVAPDWSKTIISVPTGDLAAIPAALGARQVTSAVSVPLSPLAARLALPLASLAARSRRVREVAGNRSPQQTEPSRTYVSRSWARVTTARGVITEAWLTAGEGYAFTVNGVVSAAARILAGDAPTGATTATKAFGSAFLKGLPGVRIHTPQSDGSFA